MKLLDLFRGGSNEEKALDDNPYLNARRTLNEANGALIHSRHLWQATALLALMIAIGAVSGVIHIGSQSKFASSKESVGVRCDGEISHLVK